MQPSIFDQEKVGVAEMFYWFLYFKQLAGKYILALNSSACVRMDAKPVQMDAEEKAWLWVFTEFRTAGKIIPRENRSCVKEAT